MKSSTLCVSNGRMLFFAGVLLLLATMLPAATAAPPGPSALILGAADDGRQIALTAGQVLSITLDANPSTGYRWEVDSPESAIMRQVGTRFEQPAGRLGTPGKQVLELTAVRAGQSTLRLVYRRPWEKGVQPVKAFSLRVQSQGASTLPGALTPTPVAAQTSRATVDTRPVLGLPAAFNWCSVNGCTPVKDQGSCGSCWAFGTVGPLEANVKMWDGATRDMAEQYLVSCASDSGCSGGWFAHDYHLSEIPPGEEAAGAVYEIDFPYEALDASQGVGCGFTPQPHTHHEKIAAWTYIPADDSVPAVADIKQAIYEHGPVAAAICVGAGFQGYTGGIFQTSDDCMGSVNHAIVLVGWNDADQTWYLRNSWGEYWGESGYMRIKWGTSNVGFGANYVVYGAPSHLTATPTSSSQIDLSWMDNSGAESGFRIERSEDGVTGWAQVAAVGPGVTTYSDAGLACNTTLHYRVRAFTAGANGSYSDTASAQTFVCSGAPAAPTDLTAVAASQIQIDLSWADNSDDESGFKIERSPNGASGWTRIYTTTTDVTRYSNTGLDCSTTYYYRVRAYNANGDSNNSTVAQALTLACPGCQDEYEPDDSYVQAKLIQVNGPAQQRKFHVAGDEDWAKFAAVAGRVYTITTSSLGDSNDTYLELYDTNGTTVLAHNDDGGSQPLSSKIAWIAPGDGVYYVKARHYYRGVGGCTGYEYDLALTGTISWRVYLPQIFMPPTIRTPNDPDYSLYQWGLPRVNAPAAWVESTGAGVTIAVMDTGVDLNHPDLAAKIAPGWDFTNDDSAPQDDHGHGTHVAGIAAAATHNYLGVAGLGWDARIMPVKVLDSNGYGYYSDIADGISWAADHGAQVINMSVGGDEWSQVLQDATDYAYRRGALVVAAAGNCADPMDYYPCKTHNPTFYPAANPNVLAVGATTASDVRASFSEYGDFVDVTAPGVSIYSTLWDDGYGSLSGTSMASPLVAGVAALAWAHRPALTNAQIASVIQGSATDLGAPGRDDEYGYGLVDAAEAVAAAGSLTMAALSAEESSRPLAVRTSASTPVRPGVVLIRFKPGALAADRQSALARYGLRVAGRLGTAGVLMLEAPAGQERDMAEQLAADPAVEFAEPDYQVRLIN